MCCSKMKYWLSSLCFCILSPHLLQKYSAQTALLTIVETKCITNTSSAIAPIYNLDNKLWPEPTKFTPNVKYVGRKSNLVKHCEQSYCFDNSWNYRNSLSPSRINNLITDRRWEEFPIILTKEIHKSDMEMNFDKVTSINSLNFVLPFSVLIEHEAHLFLCEGTDVSSYRCYWFMIDAWNGKNSAIRVCDAGDINKRYDGGAVPSGICRNSTADYKRATNIFSKTKWTHLKIVANNYKLKLINEEGRVLIDAINLKRNIIPRHVLIHSKRVNGMWKIHTFDYFYSEEESVTEFELDVGYGQRCLSMLLAMCNKCSLVIQILVYKFWNRATFLYSRELQNNVNENWQEHKLNFNTEKASVYLRVTKRASGEKGIFWAVRDIRTCETNELRMTQIDDQSKWTRKCQHLATGEIVDLDQPNTEKLENKNKCDEYQFGEDCISCKTIFGQNMCPHQTKYCQLVASGDSKSFRKKCYCSIGFGGPNCKDSCSASYYGHGCGKYCKNCQDSCSNDPIFGKCDSKFCTDNFQGEKCDQPSIIYIFAQEPKIEPEYTSCKVIPKSFDGSGNKLRMKFYIFQYRKKGQGEWENTASVPFNAFRMIEITGLEVQSNYELRIFGYREIPDADEMRFIENENLLPTYNFQTICREPKSNDISITTDATSATITYLKATDQKLCDINMYTYNVNETTIFISNTANPYKITNLRPFSLYVLSILRNHKEILSKGFRTLESTPGKPEGFIYEMDPYGSITLKWQQPSQINGNLMYYSIYEKIQFAACKDSNIPLETTKNVSGINKQYQVPALKPYARYSFSIRAHTIAGSSESADLSFETPAKDKPDEEEFPKFINTSLGVTQAEIDFSLVDCEKLTGPLKVEFKVKGADPWCNTHRQNSSSDPIKKFIISDLIAYCNYEVTWQYFRNSIIQKEENIKFRTAEGVPNSVKDLLVTSKGPDFFSLRWLPPHPPTGQLEKYIIAIFYNPKKWYGFKYDKSVTVLPEDCKLWPEFHCTTIAVYNEDYVYQFEISSKNRGNSAFSEKQSVRKQAEESKPGKPYGLSYSWTSQNFLYLEWFLPNETNGKLTGFDITIDGIPYEYNLDTQEEYKLKYNKIILEQFKLPKQYAVRITARNLAGTSDPDIILISESPPPIPSNSINSIQRTENSIKVIFDEPKTPIYYQRFLYGLITECDNCDGDLVEFRKVLMDHHSSHDEVETKTTISFWERILNYKFEQPTKKNLAIDISNATMNYAIRKKTPYLVVFIWINTNQGFIRSNYTSKICEGQSIRPPDDKLGSIGIASIMVLTLFLVAMLAVITVRYKTPLINKVRNIFAANEQERGINESSISLNPPVNDEAKYVNQQDLKISRHKSGRRASRCRPLSVAFTGEICPGVPQFRTKYSKRIKLEDFRQYVKQAIESGELKTQHATFPRGQTKPWDYGTLPENKKKNRYQNLIAYDHSRVVLNKFDRDEYSDYINANYIDGYQRPKAYIATQGPKPNTVEDFWQMIWEEKATHIVMMANVIEGNKKKTEQYWPNVNEEVTFGDYKITFIHSEIHANYEYRTLEVQFKYSKPRQVGQLHFKVWPDHGVPLYPQTLVPFLQKLLTLHSWDFPLVVHCSAGVGRTGTIILCDICLRMAASEGSLDVFSMLEHIRSQRPNMVDNIEQYKLAHLVILNCLMGLNTSIPVDEDFENNVKRFKNIDYQLNYIRDCEWEDEAMKTVAFCDDEELLPFDPTKNRSADIIPDKHASVFLLPMSTLPNSAYINAVQVDGFCHPSRFIVTEFPLPHTIGDFWRLIAEKDISVVVCLNEIPVNDPTCKLFWPKKNKNFVPNEIIEVKHIQNKNLQFYSIMNFALSSYYEHRGNETKEVQIVKFHGWNYPDTTVDHSDFFTFVEEAMILGRKSNQILVTCYDGATACGLFTAMSFLIEKIKLEQECDVCQAIRTIRTSRKQFCDNTEQLQFLYKASILYVQERFQTYSNINMKKQF